MPGKNSQLRHDMNKQSDVSVGDLIRTVGNWAVFALVAVLIWVAKDFKTTVEKNNQEQSNQLKIVIEAVAEIRSSVSSLTTRVETHGGRLEKLEERVLFLERKKMTETGEE